MITYYLKRYAINAILVIAYFVAWAGILMILGNCLGLLHENQPEQVDQCLIQAGIGIAILVCGSFLFLIGNFFEAVRWNGLSREQRDREWDS